MVLGAHGIHLFNQNHCNVFKLHGKETWKSRNHALTALLFLFVRSLFLIIPPNSWSTETKHHPTTQTVLELHIFFPNNHVSKTEFLQSLIQLVVSTPLKNMRQNGSSSPIFQGENKESLKPPPRFLLTHQPKKKGVFGALLIRCFQK